MDHQTEASALESSIEAESQDIAALEKLESRILEIVEQLRVARRKQTLAEEEAAQLREQLEEKQRRIDELDAQQNETESNRGAVKQRIEALLERIESIEV